MHIRNRSKAGFTLIELLVVVAILGLLATIVAVSLTAGRSRARDGRRVSDIRQIELALELYYAAHREYPTTNVYSDLINEGYLNMATAPRDPSTGNPYCYSYGDAGGTHPIQYYHIGAVLENADSDMLAQDKDYHATSGPAANWTGATRGNDDCVWEGTAGNDEDFYGGCGSTAATGGSCNSYGDDSANPVYDRAVRPLTY